MTVEELDRPLSEEDKARADCYALVSRLFYAPVDAELLQLLAGTSNLELQDGDDLQLAGWEIEADETPYTKALKILTEASANADAEALRQEYDDLFTGAGKAL